MHLSAHIIPASSECADERHVPFGGSCYLFVSYPEVDWSTARSVCSGIGAQLASLRTVDEQRFVAASIRRLADYTTHTVYWLGGEQRQPAETDGSSSFRWSDGQNMSFVGWLPGDDMFAVSRSVQSHSGSKPKADRSSSSSALPSPPPPRPPLFAPLCIALKWKMSPTPMLPSGLYWSAERCTKYGGYVCKSSPPAPAIPDNNTLVPAPDAGVSKSSPQQPFPANISAATTAIERRIMNGTIDGREGRLTSPGYPNTYPPNTDYWIRLRGPPNTRLIVQFQLIDMELQEDCLYDYVSVQQQEARTDGAAEEAARRQSAAKSLAIGGGYTAADLLAKRWYRNDLQRIGRLRRDLYGTRRTSRGSNEADFERLLLGHEIGFLRRFRDSMLAKAGMPASDLNTPDDKQRGRRRKRSYRNVDNESLDVGFAVSSAGDIAAASASTVAAVEINDPYHDADGNEPHSGQPNFAPYVRWCGTHTTNMSRFDFVSASNVALLHFHSDYSSAAMGFSAVWSTVDVSGCPAQTLTAHEGQLQSPNFPHFLLNDLQCSFEIYAGRGRRVWLEFVEFSVLQDALVEVDVGDGHSSDGASVVFRAPQVASRAADPASFTEQQQQQHPHLNDAIYVSRTNRMVVRLRTGAIPRGRGFRAVYRTVATIEETHRIALSASAHGQLYHLNYPLPMPGRINYTQHLVAPVGSVVFLEFFGVRFSDRACDNGAAMLEVCDRYADTNGTSWTLCDARHTKQTSTTMTDDVAPPPPVHITSYLNTLHVRQLNVDAIDGAVLNASVRVIADLQYKRKLATGDDTVESCQPNPCLANGRCISAPPSAGGNRCACTGYRTGRFCALTACEVSPCMYGKCQLTGNGYKCVCQDGYVGRTCDQKQLPCAANPCEGRGECFNRQTGFYCRCHAWWEGARCEKRMQNIPYKPLSDRMLQEPFWLGLITVFVVLAFIGLVWCAKRHFPEKIEKLLTEEAERNRRE